MHVEDAVVIAGPWKGLTGAVLAVRALAAISVDGLCTPEEEEQARQAGCRELGQQRELDDRA